MLWCTHQTLKVKLKLRKEIKSSGGDRTHDSHLLNGRFNLQAGDPLERPRHSEANWIRLPPKDHDILIPQFKSPLDVYETWSWLRKNLWGLAWNIPPIFFLKESSESFLRMFLKKFLVEISKKYWTTAIPGEFFREIVGWILKDALNENLERNFSMAFLESPISGMKSLKFQFSRQYQPSVNNFKFQHGGPNS